MAAPLADDVASAVVRALHEKRWCRCPDDRQMLCVESVDVVRSVLHNSGDAGAPSVTNTEVGQ